MNKFNENSRVKIPALLHLTRLGYEYLPLKEAEWDARCNLFPRLFQNAIARINPESDAADIRRAFDDIHRELQNDDLGKAFHQRLTSVAGLRLFDFDKPENNSYHVVTELAFVNGEDEFRPDITLLINGMPLLFMEVKKPNNLGGVLEERARMDRRHANPKFRHFFNLVQLMLFSNNMEYDDGASDPVQGAFYAASTYSQAHFNYFREERATELAAQISETDEEVEDRILKDNNLASIKGSPEYDRNKSSDSPTHRLLTSLCSRTRLAFLLRYAFAYVTEEDGIQKHVMRYPQLFATMAIADRLVAGSRKGIVWHTQGSGKTALAFYNIAFLTDWFRRHGQVPRFFFIVDRLDLLKQASEEFGKRGLIVHVIQSREEFIRDTRLDGAIRNDSGQTEITLVNIQRFKDDPGATRVQDYNLNVQRVYFLDEVHRSYNPKGSFLANLEQSDRNAIKIGLTGTPLIGEQLQSRALFGDYIHTYYYNASIADGYTLRLIREEIATHYKLQLQQALQSIEVKQGDIEKQALYAHPRFVEPLLDYILEDFCHSRILHADSTIGGMVICDSAAQARELHAQFQRRMAALAEAANDSDYIVRRAAETRIDYRKPLIAALILYDEGDKHFRADEIRSFKAGKIDLLFVYNMLLTGFDAPRLKKLYMCRDIQRHNLLQALTRVNRRYKGFRYGYVVDFAGIQKSFDEINREYYDELNRELGDEAEHYNQLFLSVDEIRASIEAIQAALFDFSTDDAELFSQQVSAIQDIDQLRALVKALATARELYNLIRLGDHRELHNLLDYATLQILHGEAQRALALLNLKHRLENAHDTSGLLNQALEDVIFQFEKIGEAELKLADELKDSLRRTREQLAGTRDPADPQWVSLKEELERLFKARKLSEVTQEQMRNNIGVLTDIERRAREIENANHRLQARYGGDAKLMRVHKRLRERAVLGGNDLKLHDALNGIKHELDGQLLDSRDLLTVPAYFERRVMPIVLTHFRKASPPEPDADTRQMIRQLLVNEYLNESQGRLPF